MPAEIPGGKALASTRRPMTATLNLMEKPRCSERKTGEKT